MAARARRSSPSSPRTLGSTRKLARRRFSDCTKSHYTPSGETFRESAAAGNRCTTTRSIRSSPSRRPAPAHPDRRSTVRPAAHGARAGRGGGAAARPVRRGGPFARRHRGRLLRRPVVPGARRARKPVPAHSGRAPGRFDTGLAYLRLLRTLKEYRLDHRLPPRGTVAPRARRGAPRGPMRRLPRGAVATPLGAGGLRGPPPISYPEMEKTARQLYGSYVARLVYHPW